MLLGMEERLGTKIDSTNTKVEKALDLVAETNTVLEDLELRVAATEEAIEARLVDAEGRLKNHVNEQVKTLVLDQLRSAGFDPELTAGDLSTVKSSTAMSYASAASKDPSTSTLLQQTKTKQDRQDDKYWECRRSIRLWPVAEPTRECLSRFLVDRLGMKKEEEADLGPITIRKVRKRKPRHKDEIVATFDTAETRDYVKSLAPYLANHQDEAGMRLQIPDHLQRLFRVFMNLSFDLKKKHQELKRSVKFDDLGMTLYMDVQLQRDGPWRRIDPDQALKLSLIHI